MEGGGGGRCDDMITSFKGGGGGGCDDMITSLKGVEVGEM